MLAAPNVAQSINFSFYRNWFFIAFHFKNPWNGFDRLENRFKGINVVALQRSAAIVLILHKIVINY